MSVQLLFDEVLLDPSLLTVGGAEGGPEYANTLARSPLTGIMKVNVPRQDPQHVWQCDYKMVTPSEGGGSSNEMDYFNQFWYGGSGSAYGFRVRVETDHLLLLEVLGTSDGTTASKTWKVTKKYNRPGTTSHPYYRYLCKPVATANLSGDSVTLYEPDGGTARVVESAFKVYFGNVEQTTGW